MLKKQVCKHCVGLFQPVRTGHLYCSDSCRKLAFKAKNRAKTQAKRNKKLSEKLKKLVNSAFGKYLVKEIRRAGSVEILQGHNSETLTDLVKLRRRCTALGGYDDGDSLNHYELSHIYPVSGKDRVGLLNLSNLAITPKTFNRKHGTKLPIEGYMGSSIPRASLLNQWKIATSLDSLEVLKITRKYLGEEFDIWLKKHLINQTQKGAILKKLKEAGYDSNVLKIMGLRELKAIAEEKEIPYFSITKEPEKLSFVLFKELERLELNPALMTILEKTIESDWFLEPPNYHFDGSKDELNVFEEFICEQVLLCIHGQSFKQVWNKKSFESLFIRQQEKPEQINKKYFDDDEIL